jgi:hypothetical protein
MAAKKKTKKKAATKKFSPKKKAVVKKRTAGAKKRKSALARTKRTRRAKRSEYAVPRPGRGAASAGQSGDLQGLPTIEDVDSESVDELLEEGNAFEAGVVEGVEDAGSHREREVHTREVPEDDVPEEYRNGDN